MPMGPWEHATLEGVRVELGRVARENAWEAYHSPLNLTLALQKEVGGLAEVFQFRPAAAVLGEDDRVGIEARLGDVLAYTVRMADECGIDLGAAINRACGQPRSTQAAPADARVSSPSDPPASTHEASSRTARKPAPDAAPHTPPPQSQPRGRHPFKRTLSVLTMPVTPAQQPVGQMSPSHYDHDLFSPTTDKKDFEVEYNNERPVLPLSLSKEHLQATPPPISPLSPTSMNGFYQNVDALGEYNASELRTLDLRFVAPLNGNIVELCVDGSNITLTCANRPEFFRLVQQLQKQGEAFLPRPLPTGTPPPGAPVPAAAVPATAVPSAAVPVAAVPSAAVARAAPVPSAAKLAARPGTSGSPQGAASPAQKKKHALKRTLSVQLPQQKAWGDDEQPMFSPTHFEHDLFSPSCKQTDFEIEYGVEGEKRYLPQSLSKQQFQHNGAQHGAGNERATSCGSKDTVESPSEGFTARRPSVVSFGSDDEEYIGLDLLCEVAEEKKQAAARAEPEQKVSPTSREMDSCFFSVINEIENMMDSGRLTEGDLEEMELTFCIPGGGKIYDLVMNGSKRRVTLETLPQYIHLAKAKRQELDKLAANGMQP
eukprot:TRINITY_DN1076_c0_g4_i1.p1 TRINITY_DN1076_c0_g4~~TRINITY_DN1076_c0_g4_i1.p1  ORF type:complete len:599 (+),score=164.11 TRINITY_DN1076_c0_g4_i1:76-1872(+)